MEFTHFCTMKNNTNKWFYLITLSIIWGSSFILIKKGLIGLTPYQLGSLRIIFTGLFLFLIGFKSVKTIQKEHYKPIIVSALLGSFIPVYCFALAETEIDSAIASILNSLTPLNTLIFGYFIFKMVFSKKQLIGIIIGLSGTLLLIISGANLNPEQNYWFSIFVIIASICYAFNVNIIKTHLRNVSPMAIAVGNFMVIFIPALIVLAFTGFFTSKIIYAHKTHTALAYIAILSIFGTGIAKIMFNKLVHISTPIFASSVTYTIPIVALFWGILDGEKMNFIQVIASAIILIGVFLANRKS